MMEKILILSFIGAIFIMASAHSENSVERYLDDVNWALNKPSTQSSTYGYGRTPDCDAKWANDGSMFTRSVTQDHAGAAWWQVDLRQVIKIKDVTLKFNGYPLKRDYYKDVVILTKINEKAKWTVCKEAGHLTSTPVVIKCEHPTNAQFVRLALKSKTRLYLGELEVHGSPDVNWALNKPSTQSSTYGYGNRPDCDAKWANDGSMDTRSVTQDWAGAAWWQVDLQEAIKIKDVTLKFNDYPLKADYYRDVVILTKINEKARWTVCKEAGHLTSTPVVIKCDRPTEAQFVRLALKNKARLYLGELEVHGSPGMRCNGQDGGCCTDSMACNLGEGDCDKDSHCAGSLICGTDNCPWGDGDDCCMKKPTDTETSEISEMRCNGQDSGCCTDSTPCDLGEGDCDKKSHCAGSLICGTDNCPWGDNDDCCMPAIPNLADTVWDWYYDGKNINGIISLTKDGRVKWNHGAPHGSWSVNNDILTITFNGIFHRLKLDGSGAAVLFEPKISPPSKMIENEMRCNGQDNGCCTSSTPCNLGEGDCDYNSHCNGSLICGTDNCPWGDWDDCCMKAIPNLADTVWDWYHDGKNKNGRVTLLKDGRVKWNDDAPHGSWRVKNDILTITFNGIFHRLKLDGSGAAVLFEPKRSPPSKMIKNEMRCNGQDSGCCTDSTPCDLGEGDCDKHSDCAGSMICGTDNCPWGDWDDCCMKAIPNLADTAWDWYHDGKNQNGIITLTRDGRVKWNHGAPHGSWSVKNDILTITFNGIFHKLKLDGSGAAVLFEPKRRHPSKMIKNEMRCNGQDSGCCTDSTPCDLGEGDCDKNSHCAGSLICGTDNCPWGDWDDCCMKALNDHSDQLKDLKDEELPRTMMYDEYPSQQQISYEH